MKDTERVEVQKRFANKGLKLNLCGEAVLFGSSSALETVLLSIVDEEYGNKRNRNNLFNPNFKCLGVHSSKHLHSGMVTVFCLSDNMVFYQENQALKPKQSNALFDNPLFDKWDPLQVSYSIFTP